MGVTISEYISVLTGITLYCPVEAIRFASSNDGLTIRFISLENFIIYYRAFFQLVHEGMKLIQIKGLGAVA